MVPDGWDSLKGGRCSRHRGPASRVVAGDEFPWPSGPARLSTGWGGTSRPGITGVPTGRIPHVATLCCIPVPEHHQDRSHRVGILSCGQGHFLCGVRGNWPSVLVDAVRPARRHDHRLAIPAVDLLAGHSREVVVGTHGLQGRRSRGASPAFKPGAKGDVAQARPVACHQQRPEAGRVPFGTELVPRQVTFALFPAG